MDQHFSSRVGGVMSADIAVPEHEREVRFYSRVLTTGTDPLWRDDLMNNLGLPIIGLGERTEEYERLPLQWMPHIQVADVGESVRRAGDLGGEVLMHAQDEDGASQWAVLRDPDGAAFGLIPLIAPEHLPPADADAPADVGRIQRVELTVADADAAQDFYRQVVGWTVQPTPMEDGAARYDDYTLLGAGGAPAGAIRHARGANAGLPPVWLLYLAVADLAESLGRVADAGGEVVREVPRSDASEASAVLRDPVGVYVALRQGPAPGQ